MEKGTFNNCRVHSTVYINHNQASISSYLPERSIRGRNFRRNHRERIRQKKIKAIAQAKEDKEKKKTGEKKRQERRRAIQACRDIANEREAKWKAQSAVAYYKKELKEVRRHVEVDKEPKQEKEEKKAEPILKKKKKMTSNDSMSPRFKWSQEMDSDYE